MANVKISQLPQTSVVCANALIPLVQNGVTCSTYACNLGGGGGGGIIVSDTACNSTIRCGVGNCVTSPYGAALSGFCNTTSSYLSGCFNVGADFIGGGGCNTISSYYPSSIVAGFCNTITNGGHSHISDGCCNTISSYYGFIGTGRLVCL